MIYKRIYQIESSIYTIGPLPIDLTITWRLPDDYLILSASAVIIDLMIILIFQLPIKQFLPKMNLHRYSEIISLAISTFTGSSSFSLFFHM